MKGWLLDTYVIASLSAANGAPTVKAWAATQDEERFYLSVLTLAEYDKGIHQLPEDDPSRARYEANRNAIAARFGPRLLSLNNAVVLRWGMISGRIRRDTGHPPSVAATMLAATAMEHGLYFVTRNTADARLTGVAIFNPWQDDLAGFPLI